MPVTRHRTGKTTENTRNAIAIISIGLASRELVLREKHQKLDRIAFPVRHGNCTSFPRLSKGCIQRKTILLATFTDHLR